LELIKGYDENPRGVSIRKHIRKGGLNTSCSVKDILIFVVFKQHYATVKLDLSQRYGIPVGVRKELNLL
jgi:hypothetical protein